MNVLIVDDQINVLEGIASGVNWETLNIKEIYKCLNIIEAKDVLTNRKIDILICDIEMPHGTGIDLLKWVRDENKMVECIFLSAHAKFEYASEAIKLRSFDYVLQPVKYAELETVIAKAINKIHTEKNKERMESYGIDYSKNVDKYLNSLIRDILLGNKNALDNFFDNPSVKETNIHNKTIVFPILLSLLRQKELLGIDVKKLDEDQLNANINEFFKDDLLINNILSLGSGKYLFIINRCDSTYLQNLYLTLNKLIDTLKLQYNSTVACYINEPIFIKDIYQTYCKLREMDYNNVGLQGRVFIENPNISNKEMKNINWKRFSTLLENKHSDIFLNEIENYFQDLILENSINYNLLFNFLQNFLMMVYSITENLGLTSEELFGTDHGYELYNLASSSVDNMIKFVEYIIVSLDSHLENGNEFVSITDKVKKYIADNINREISRNDIANHVYLNPEYLSRIFKKETGEVLSEYIIREKIKIAQSYLTKTNMPIGIIASKLGYTNFSYFTKMFKRETGVTPNEYRQNLGLVSSPTKNK